MQIDWKTELSKINPRRIAFLVGLSSFLIGLILGTREDGLSHGLFLGVMFTFSAAVFAWFLIMIAGLFAGFLVILNNSINESAVLTKYIQKAFRWLQDRG